MNAVHIYISELNFDRVIDKFEANKHHVVSEVLIVENEVAMIFQFAITKVI